MDEQEYVTLDEAAEKIGINRATVYRWVQRLNIKTHRFIGSRRTWLAAADLTRIKDAHEKPWLAGEKPEEAVA
jgi:excisionase family DNA binding protein